MESKKKRKTILTPKPNTGTGKTYYVKNDLSEVSFGKVKKSIPKKNQVKKIEINSTKINLLLNTLNGAEFNYLHSTIELAKNFKDLIKYYNLSKERFCEEMKISKGKYNSYIKGSRNYDLRDIARLQSLSLKLNEEKEQADKNPKSPIEYIQKKGKVQINK